MLGVVMRSRITILALCGSTWNDSNPGEAGRGERGESPAFGATTMDEPDINTDRYATRTASPHLPRVRVGLVGVDYWLSPILLTATACGVLLVLRGPDRWFGYALAALLGIAVAWILVSALHPARADRACSDCGQPTLERANPLRTTGVRCSACGRYDPEASAFLMAEEEGVVDTLVVSERLERSRARNRSTQSAWTRSP